MIILEDDTLPDLSFFNFCEKLLLKYEKNPKISMISGTNLSQENSKAAESYFFQNIIIFGVGLPGDINGKIDEK